MLVPFIENHEGCASILKLESHWPVRPRGGGPPRPRSVDLCLLGPLTQWKRAERTTPCHRW